jgi:hypothetical protein
MTTQVLEETAATSSDQDSTTERGASTINPELKTQVSIWRPGLVVAGAVLAAALAAGGSQFTLTTSQRRRLDSEFAASGTAAFECDAEILDEVRLLFDQGATEFFHDGLHSHFSRRLLDLLARHGGVALHAIAQYLVSDIAKEDVVSEALRWIADYRDPATMTERGRLLRRSLRSSLPRVRDGAVLGLSTLDDPRALPFLEEARQAESIHELRRLIDAVIEQLRATAHASAAANGQGEPLV